MQNISAPEVGQVEKSEVANILITILFLVCITAIALFKSIGIIFACLILLGVIVVPLYYNKPHIFLLFSVLIYPFTRILPLGDKFIITGALYTLSMPCAIWVFFTYFKRISKSSVYLWAMLMYIVVILFNIFRPQTELIGLAKEFGRTFYAIFIILSVYNYVEQSPLNLKKLCNRISYVMNIIALVGIGQYITRIGGMNQDGIYRVIGTFTGFNDYAFVLSFFICFSLYFLLNAGTTKARVYWTATLALNLIALTGTVSKTSMINTALIFVIMSMFLSWKRKLQLLAIGLVIGSVLLDFLIVTGAYSSLITRFGDTTSLTWRMEIWRTLYNMILQGNVWLGEGVNASRNFLQLLVVPGESYAPHNVYLETAYNFGLLGLIPFVLMFVFALFQGAYIFLDRGIENNQNRIIGISVIIIAIIAMIQNYVSNAYYDRAGNLLYWVIMTLMICWYNYYKARSKKV